MNDTPMTDAARSYCRALEDLYGCQPIENLCRTLERELASTTYAAQTLAESLKTTQLQVQELGGQLAAAQEELKQMRILAANPHSIQSVKDHLGPLSMWSQSGLEEHDRQILQAANAEIEALRKDYNELIMALAAATQMVSVPRIKAGSQDGWLVEFAWLKKVKTALRSMPDWEDCSIDLEEIEAVALAMLAAKGDRNG